MWFRRNVSATSSKYRSLPPSPTRSPTTPHGEKDVGVGRPHKNEILRNIPPTPDQEYFIKLMELRRQASATLLGRMLSETEGKVAIATDYARKMALTCA